MFFHAMKAHSRLVGLGWFLGLTVGALLPLSVRGQEEKLNDAFLLRQLKRFPAADKNGDGRLTTQEWQEFQAGAKLKKEMREDEEAVLKTKGDKGVRLPPTHAEVAYGPFPEQRLNVWLMPSEQPTPLIIHLHGGGFIQGSKQDHLDLAVQEKLAAAKVSYASIQYRFQSKDLPLPEVLLGIARAVQFLRHQAGEWNLDKQRFAAFGGSAGAAASTWLGMRDDLADPTHSDPVLRESTRLKAVWAISVAPTMDVWEWPKYNPHFTPKMVGSWIKRWGYDPDTDPNDPEVLAWRKGLRFATLASADDPPMVIYNAHFADNVAHNPQASKALFDICNEAGIEVALYMREIVSNLEAAPNMHDWLIQRLQAP
jgi:acetyl esterase/lipase